MDLWVPLALALVVTFAAPGLAQEAPSSSPAVANHVLDLDGTNSWLELPQNLFTNQLVTVEGWVKWRAFGSYSRFFQFAGAALHLAVLNSSTNNTLRVERYNAPPFGDLRVAEVPDALRLGEWQHIALVATTNGLRLLVNGVLVTTNEAPLDFRPDPLPPLNNLLGRSLVKDASNVSGDTDLNGQMDEVRLWAGGRSQAQIRENMFHPLTGAEPGLLGLWNFNNVTNGMVKDASPGGHDGRLMGNARVAAEQFPQQSAPPPPERVLKLDGTNSFVEFPSDAFTNLTKATIEGWVNWQSFNSSSRFFDFVIGGQRCDVQNRYETSTLHLERIGVDNNDTMELPIVLSTNRWVHVAAVVGPETLKLYFNGVLAPTNVTHGQWPTAGVEFRNYLGRSNWRTIEEIQTNAIDGDFHGLMDEVSVWRGERTEAQIREDLLTSLTGTEPGLVALWNFDDGTARDVTGHGHDGILHGQAVTVEGQPALNNSNPAGIASVAPAPGVEPVLDLNGVTGHVQLPPHILDGLQEVTIEGWVKWRSFVNWPRLFTFGKGEHRVGLMTSNSTNEMALVVDEQITPWIGQLVTEPNAMTAGKWVHVACVLKTNGATLIVNGRTVDSNPNALFSTVKENTENALGSTFDGGGMLDGQMNEIRIWKTARTEAQIRKTLFKSLTGREPGLLSLWNFSHVNNGVVKDLGPGGFDGQLIGVARIVASDCPAATATTISGWTTISGKITDTASNILAKATIRAEVNGEEIARATSRDGGGYELTINAPAPAVDLQVIAAGDIGDWQRVDLNPTNRWHDLDWKLKPALHVAGKLTALDGKTPLATVVVELVQPAGTETEFNGSRREEVPSENQKSEIRSQNSSQSLETSPATNRVLQLDGNGCLVLPTNLFKPYNEATIEGWVKWDKLVANTDFFDFGTRGFDAWITAGAYKLDNSGFGNNPPSDIQASLSAYEQSRFHGGAILVHDILRAHQWFHLALVTGPGGMKLLVNGVLAGSDPFTGSFATFTNLLGAKNSVGRDNYFNATLMTGQIDELCAWKTARTAAEIHSDMLTKLTGQEPGLLGLWNFDDRANPGKDSTTNGFDAQLIGTAQTVAQDLPLVVTGRITDASGRRLSKAQVEVKRADGESTRSPTDADGNYAFTIQPSERDDLFATDGEHSAYRLGFQPSGKREQRLDWVLTETGIAAAPASNPQSSQSLLTSVATNCVLRLTGTNSYVELPTNMLRGATEITLEAWWKWEEFGNYSAAFNFGDGEGTHFLIYCGGHTNGLLSGFAQRSSGIKEGWIYQDNILALGRWCHTAVVLSTNGLRLYLDGRLLGTNAYTPRFFTDGPVQRFVFGHSLPGLDDFHGEMDDVRLWRTARTQDQIRANMTARLTGQEPGLIGLWNFDDPAHPGKDATPNGLDGQLIGSAKTVTEIIPTVLITGRITDASGRGLTNAYVELRRANVSINHAQTGPDGYYAFTMQPDERGDLFATDGERSAFRLGFQPSGSRQQRLDWVLTETGVAAAPASNPQSSQSLLTSAATGEPGTVVASVLTKDDGSFDFANLKPGIYQLRCQTPGGRTWFENGRPFRMEPDLPAADAQKLKAQEWSIEPFKKGRWRKFGVLEELKSNNTGRTLFAADGTLWNSANGGLVRFDGREFFMLSSDNGLGVSTSHPLACYLDHTGMLWVGTADGLRRYRPADGVPQTRFSPPGLPTDNIFEIAGTADGAVWWRTGRNLVRYHDGQGTVFTNLWSANPGVLERLAVTVNRLWVTGPGAGLVCFEGTNQVRWTQQQGLPADDTGTVATAPDGTVWFAIGDDGARGAMRFDGTRFVRLMPRDGLHTGGITCIHVASDGLVWFGLAEGTVARFDGRSFIYFDNSSDATGRKSSAVNSKIYDIQQGSDGATWFGTSDRLWRFEENTFRQYSTEDGLPAGGLHFGVGVLMTTPDGSLMALVGTNGMTARFDGQRFWSNALPVAVNHMVSGPDGIIHGALPATPRAPARIALLQGGNILSVLTNSAGQPGGEFQCLTRAADGAIWAGTATNGVVRFAGTNGGPAMTWTNGLLTNSIIAIHGDAHGAVWVAAQGGGIVRFDGTNWTEFTQTNGAPGRVVVGVESGPDGSIWFGAYDGGLARFDGQTMKPVTAGGGTFIPSAVIKIFRAADGTLWFGTLTGVTHYDGATWAPLDEGDGLQPGAVWAIAQDSNGAIWFGGENGLTRYEPRVSTNSMPALIVQTDRAYTNLNELPHITDGRLVTFKLNAVDFRTRPEKRLYRYAVVADRTESPPAKTDTRWNTPTRATQFEWPAPKRGDYTVFVQEIDRDMNYSTPAVAHLTVVPPWYFNGWIMVPSGGLFLGLFGWAFVARVLYFRKRREAEQLREEMANRDHEARARLEKEVREREQVQDYFQSLVESVPVMVYRRDIEGRITFMNRNGSAFFAKAFDTPENPTAGKDIGYGMLEGIVTPKVIARLKEAHHEVIRTGRLMESESKIERLVGPDIWLHSIRTPVVASDGRISGVQYVTWDVTQEQRYLI